MGERLLILSGSFGAGHLRAARALEAAARASLPDRQVEVVQLAGQPARALSAGYLCLLHRKPDACRTLYRIPADVGLRQMIAAVMLPEVWHHVRRFRPTTVIVTHPFPGLAAGTLKASGGLNAILGAALTDFHPHPLWVHPAIDRYFVAAEETGRLLHAADQLLYAAPERLARMREAARLAGRPRAAEAAVNEIFARSSQNHRISTTA